MQLNRIRLLISLLSFSFTTPMFAQENAINIPIVSTLFINGNFSGKVTDAKTGVAIQGASVFIPDIKYGASSDASGHFMIKNIPIGLHLVEVSHIGYSSNIENIDITNNTIKDFALIASILENNAIIVTGVTGATQLKKVPFSVTVIRKQDFFRGTSSNIIESLTKIGGVATLASGPAIAKPVIRGLSYNRVLTVNDGVRQEGQQWGDEHGIEIDEASVNKIELLKGPASIIYGSDAMAGVINIITNIPLPVNTLKANIAANYQTNNNLRTFNFNLGFNRNGFNWNIYSSNKAAADYQNKYDGKVFNSKFNEQNIGGYLGYNGKWGHSHLIISNFNLKAGLIEGERDAAGFFLKPVTGGGTARATEKDFNSTTPQFPYQHIRHFKIATDNSFTIGNNRLSFNAGYQVNQREEFGNIDVPDERALFFNLSTFTYTAQFHFAEKAGWKNAIGLNGMQQNNLNKGVEQLIPDYSLFDFGIYAYTQKKFKKLTFSGGIRFDSRSIAAANLLDGSAIKGNAFTKSFSNVSGSIGLAAQLTTKLNLKLNIARGFRAPSIPELASNGTHEGTTRYEYGNTFLKSETSLQIDAGIEYSTEHVSLGVAAFYNRFNNFIFYRKLQSVAGGDSMVTQNGNDFTAFRFDQRKATLGGLEATVDIHPHPLDWLHILHTFSLVSGRFNEAIEGAAFLPFIPATRLSTEFKGSFNKLSTNLRNFYVLVEIDNIFKKSDIFTAYNTETTTNGYTLFNAGIGVDITTKKEQTLFSIGFSAINISDAAYQNHLSRLKYAAENVTTRRMGVFNMGRNFSIKINIPLSIKLGK